MSPRVVILGEPINALRMNPEQQQLLTLSMLPARLSAEQAAQLLGFQAHELTILIAAGLLRPLGRPAAKPTPPPHPQWASNLCASSSVP